MFKQILVPVDGSIMAEAALPAAVFLAEKFQAGDGAVVLIARLLGLLGTFLGVVGCGLRATAEVNTSSSRTSVCNLYTGNE